MILKRLVHLLSLYDKSRCPRELLFLFNLILSTLLSYYLLHLLYFAQYVIQYIVITQIHLITFILILCNHNLIHLTFLWLLTNHSLARLLWTFNTTIIKHSICLKRPIMSVHFYGLILCEVIWPELPVWIFGAVD
jgi:hypothetical protein